ncbi:MAG: hypothetical protein FWG85_02475 [Bacteroidetes bacterium]|nr:hypothetical protein [Bacteroidota bacterium]
MELLHSTCSDILSIKQYRVPKMSDIELASLNFTADNFLASVVHYYFFASIGFGISSKKSIFYIKKPHLLFKA